LSLKIRDPARPPVPAIATGSVTERNVDGSDPTPPQLFGGMPSVRRPEDLPQIAFAGQPNIAGWGGSSALNPAYSQSDNYIFLNARTSAGFASAPMESGAPLTVFSSAYQGRAPAWSPDGQTIAFESNRPFGGQTNGGANYAIYLFDLQSGAITQVTTPALRGQHAKFFPCGTNLIFCINHSGGTPKTMGIAWGRYLRAAGGGWEAMKRSAPNASPPNSLRRRELFWRSKTLGGVRELHAKSVWPPCWH
jgi:hypothetical protein